MTEREEHLLNSLFDLKRGITYYESELTKYPNDSYIQTEFKRRKEYCEQKFNAALNELKGGDPFGN